MRDVDGWDDPRLLTLNGLRRRGYTANAVNQFCEDIGVTQREGITIPMKKLESVLRNELDVSAARAFAVIHPLRVTITNYTGGGEEIIADNHPKTDMGTRVMKFSRSLFIDHSDFREEDDSNFFGLAPGKEVRLLQAYNVKCVDVMRDEGGAVCELLCTYDPDKSAKVPKGKIQWVEASSAVRTEFRLYDYLFTEREPDRVEKGWMSCLNPHSLIISHGVCEAVMASFATKAGTSFQLQRLGYFTIDTTSSNGAVVMNRTVTLRDSKGK